MSLMLKKPFTVGAALVAVVFGGIWIMGCGGGASKNSAAARGATTAHATAPAPTMNTAQAAPPAPLPAPATTQAVDELDRTIREISSYLNERIPRGDKVAFVSARQNFPMLAEYIIENLIENAVNDRSFTVIDRAQLDAVRAELQFQTSGEVSDESVRSLGRIVGAKTIVTVAISQIGDIYRFGVRALEVESAEIQGQINRNVPSGRTIDALAGAQAPAPVSTTSTPTRAATTTQPATTQTAQTTTQSAASSRAEPQIQGTMVPGNSLTEKLAWIANRPDDGTHYDIVIDNNVSLRPTTVSTLGRNVTITIRSLNTNNIRIIQLESQGYLFTIDANITLVLEDIILQGMRSNNAALVLVGHGGKLVLNNGSKITLNTNTGTGVENFRGTPGASGGGIFVNGGTLEMNDGSEIVRNRITTRNWAFGGGICIENNGNATIRGGLVSENIVTSEDRRGWWVAGGGISIRNGSSVTMHGGIISRNSVIGGAAGGGGGVFVDVGQGSKFDKHSLPGSNTSGIIFGGTGDNANRATRGFAVFRESGRQNRNLTLNNFDVFSSSSDVGWEN